MLNGPITGYAPIRTKPLICAAVFVDCYTIDSQQAIHMSSFAYKCIRDWLEEEAIDKMSIRDYVFSAWCTNNEWNSQAH